MRKPQTTKTQAMQTQRVCPILDSQSEAKDNTDEVICKSIMSRSNQSSLNRTQKVNAAPDNSNTIKPSEVMNHDNLANMDNNSSTENGKDTERMHHLEEDERSTRIAKGKHTGPYYGATRSNQSSLNRMQKVNAGEVSRGEILTDGTDMRSGEDKLPKKCPDPKSISTRCISIQSCAQELSNSWYIDPSKQSTFSLSPYHPPSLPALRTSTDKTHQFSSNQPKRCKNIMKRVNPFLIHVMLVLALLAILGLVEIFHYNFDHIPDHESNREPTIPPHPSPWGPNIVVKPGQDRTLPAGVIDVTEVHVFGILRCNISTVTTLSTEKFIVYDGGEFQCGTPNAPVTGFTDIVLSGNPDDDDRRSFVVENGGIFSIYGDTGRSARSLLREDAPKGSTTLQLRDSVDGKWEIGDEIVLSTTDFNRQPSFGQNEQLIIKNISNGGLDVEVHPPLNFSHYGGDPIPYASGVFFLDESAHVMNLRRSIRIRSDDESGPIGGHLKFLQGSHVEVVGLELSHMGQAGRIGRYPFHWHLCGEVSGQFIKHSSIHKSFQRCIVIHGTNNALVEDNTCFDFHGHGIMLEDGNEVQNMIHRNLVVLAKKAIQGLELLQSEHVDADIDRFPSPSGIWISNPSNDIVGNHVISSEGTGLWMAFVNYLCCKPDEGCTINIGSASECTATFGTSAEFMEVNKLPTGRFDGNVGASSVVGMNWDGAPIGAFVDNPNNQQPSGHSLGLGDRKLQIIQYTPPEVPVFKNNVMYKNSRRALYFRGEQAIFEGSIFADNANAPLFAYNQVLKDCLLVGWSANAELDYFHDHFPGERQIIKFRYHYGLQLYDGPLVLDNVWAAGFPPISVTRDDTPDSRSYAPMLIGTTGAGERFGNYAKKVYFEDDLKPAKLLDFQIRNQAASLYDDSGDLGGVANATITGGVPINYDSNCIKMLGGSQAILCTNYKVGTVQFLEGHRGGFQLSRVSPDGGVIKPDDPTFTSRGETHFQVITSRAVNDYRYHITRLGAETHQQMRYKFRHDSKHGLSPPLLLHYGDQCSGIARWKYINDFTVYDTEDDLAQHTIPGRTAIFYDDVKKVAGIRSAANWDRTSLGIYPGAGALAESYFGLACRDSFIPSPPVNLEKPAIGINHGTISGANRDELRIRGWACIVGYDQAAILKVETDDGETLLSSPTDRPSEEGVHSWCRTPFGNINHRFDITIKVPEVIVNNTDALELTFSLQIPSSGTFEPFAHERIPILSSKFTDYLQRLKAAN